MGLNQVLSCDHDINVIWKKIERRRLAPKEHPTHAFEKYTGYFAYRYQDSRYVHLLQPAMYF